MTAKTNIYIYIRSELVVVCFMLLAACGLTSCVTEGKHVVADDSNLVAVGQKLPSFSVTCSDGTTISTPLLGGKPSVIILFNTACSDCRRELPVLQDIYEEYGNRVNFLCISREEGNEAVRAYWDSQKLTLPYSAQEDRGVFSLFALRSIPRVYVSDAALTVSHVFAERVNGKTLRKAIETLLSK